VITGLKEAQDKLQKLINVGDSISFTELFNPQFISEHTQFKDIEELINKSGFKVQSIEDFEAIPDDQWEVFITENTSFDSRENMQKTAFDIFTKNILNT